MCKRERQKAMAIKNAIKNIDNWHPVKNLPTLL